MSGQPPAAAAPPRVPRVLFAVVAPLQNFFRTEAAGGIVLMVAAALAVLWANSPFHEGYHHLFEVPLEVRLAGRGLSWPLHHWINDALMAVFFLVAGMEIKRELAVGELRTIQRASLPMLAAVGGMLVPAVIYAGMTRSGPALRGWGVPMATDIAFALGCLSLIRSRVPRSLFVFLTALAIFDDLGAIIVIAIFYGGEMNVGALAAAGGLTAVLVTFSLMRMTRLLPYVVVGSLLWVAVLQSGIHATIAGVIVGLAIPARPSRRQRDVLRDIDAALDPLRAGNAEGSVAALERHLETMQSPLDRLLGGLHTVVAFGIVPLFALANAGVSLKGGASDVTAPVSVGAFLGLVLGKPIGVFAATWAAVRTGFVPRPTNATWLQILGVSALAGIGFTMSLFIGGLAFASHPDLVDKAKIGVFAGSLVSACAGLLLLRLAPADAPTDEHDDRPILVDGPETSDHPDDHG
jgi:Na+:H+ antiporter, NhaA family